ncbi:hypothetical protein B0J11DRAFT_122314 [Dendryphion nanum]|uniref:Uncharacterized protein n=1 Tax=Dendryphion nanum TaxID=256645 RepID=A0A9P9D977_9PLEO|nr:hypothetical protein B0J11DRAFT_122314 [Dendryphion nanum]
MEFRLPILGCLILFLQLLSQIEAKRTYRTQAPRLQPRAGATTNTRSSTREISSTLYTKNGTSSLSSSRSIRSSDTTRASVLVSSSTMTPIISAVSTSSPLGLSSIADSQWQSLRSSSKVAPGNDPSAGRSKPLTDASTSILIATRVYSIDNGKLQASSVSLSSNSGFSIRTDSTPVIDSSSWQTSISSVHSLSVSQSNKTSVAPNSLPVNTTAMVNTLGSRKFSSKPLTVTRISINETNTRSTVTKKALSTSRKSQKSSTTRLAGSPTRNGSCPTTYPADHVAEFTTFADYCAAQIANDENTYFIPGSFEGYVDPCLEAYCENWELDVEFPTMPLTTETKTRYIGITAKSGSLRGLVTAFSTSRKVYTCRSIVVLPVPINRDRESFYIPRYRTPML